MKFIVSSSMLQKQLANINGVIASNPVVPILENFLFQLEEGTLTASASDLNISMTTQISVESNDSASIAVPAKQLMETLKMLPDQPVTFEVDEENSRVEITSYKGKYKLSCERAEDFPKLPQTDSDLSVEVSSEALSRAINMTLFAVSNDELRPAMTGIYTLLENDKATFVATDGHRLIKYERTDVSSSETTSMIVPKKALALLKTSLPADLVEVKMEFSDSHVFYTFENITLIARLIDENYPDYQNAIPTDNPNIVEIDRMDILNSLKRLAIYANKTTHQIKVKLGRDSLHISAEDLDFANEAHETLVCRYDGEEMEIGFNVKFLVDVLNTISSEEVSLAFADPNKACIVLPKEKEEEEEVLMLVMPVMLTNAY